jgi:DNA invertase Pin-like site-specific DNA recombinase
MRTAMRQMMGVFSQLERGMIAARLRAGRRLKAEQGGFAYGSPRFGYKATEKALIPDDDEQASLQRIAELRQEGRSLRQIAAALEAEGHRTKRGNTSWSVASLSRVVARLEAA